MTSGLYSTTIWWQFALSHQRLPQQVAKRLRHGCRAPAANHLHRTRPDCFYSVFCQTETWEVLSSVNGSRAQPAHRSRRVMPAKRAIKSSSEGQT